jgi:hypothetical protein
MRSKKSLMMVLCSYSRSFLCFVLSRLNCCLTSYADRAIVEDRRSPDQVETTICGTILSRFPRICSEKVHVLLASTL